jgi:hypothetical protein
MKIRITLLFFFFTINLFAQDFKADYTPFSTTNSQSKVIPKIESSYNRDLKKAKKHQYKKQVKEIYTTRYEDLMVDVEDGYYISDDDVNDYFNKILEEIFTKNPTIRNQDIRLLISRSPAPNASCIGEGTIVLNIGLLNRLENESQIAFVLCHEIAHYSKNHVNHSISKYVKKRYSRATKQELKRISREKYNKTAKALELLKDFVYDSRRHSRNHEEEADEIALEYLKNTNYDARAAVSCLEILDHIDEEKYKDALKLKDLFNHSEYPYKERWGKKEEFMTIEDSEDPKDFNSDSLKTHPACQNRKQILAQLLTNYNEAGHQLFIQDQIWFSNFKTACDFEIVAQSYEYGNLAYSMFYAIQLLEKYPDNVFLHATIGKAFYRYEQARNEHKGSKYVPLISNGIEPPIYDLILMLNNLRTRELAKVAYYFLSKTKDQYLSDEDFLFAYYVHSKRIKKEEEAAALKELYLDRFPKGRFVSTVGK